MSDYSYQKNAAKKVLKNSLNGNYIASVLAACPSSGKTTISHRIINNYLLKYPSAKVVVLTEGQNTLKIQYLEELESPNIDINFTFGTFDSNAQVRVGLPQSIKKLNWKNIDLIIIDEAQNYYLAPTVQNIIKKLKPIHKILMTGSPTKYNKHNTENAKKFAMYYISAENLKDMGVFSSVDLDVVKVDNRKNPTQTIKKVMLHAKKTKVNLEKIMVACPNIEYAKIICNYLSKCGRSVSLSISTDSGSDSEIKRFKDNETNTLVVVNKGVLGFNDSNITALLDMKSSNNVDASYQLFARILRKHKKNIRKTYIRIGSGNFSEQSLVLHKMVALMKTSIFKQFTGDNLELR